MPEAVEAELTFAVDTGTKPVTATHGPGGRLRRYVGTFEPHRVAIRDARGEAPSLDVEGMELRRHETAVVDFRDPDERRAVYEPEVKRLIAEASGASEVVIFDTTVRSGDEAEQEAEHLREPVRIAHNDYTEWSGPERLRRALGEERARARLARRFAIVQVWRATHEPIEVDPLALCDARSVRPEELLAAERRHADRVGEIYQLMYAPTQRWLYFPRMRRDEALVFKVYDSATDGRARFTPHASFRDPTARPDAPVRRSLEVRALAFF